MFKILFNFLEFFEIENTGLITEDSSGYIENEPSNGLSAASASIESNDENMPNTFA